MKGNPLIPVCFRSICALRGGVRIEHEEALYVVICSGDRRERILHGEEDRALFLQTWKESKK
jgi:hypothetical protein